jgi:glutamine amidotransferase
MTVAIVDYGSGNLRSVAKALERVAGESRRPGRVIVTADAGDVARAERIVLPGVGAFADCMKGLDGLPGMVETLTQNVLEEGRPFLGICVGMQLMAERGLEHGSHAGLGWIGGEVVPIEPGAGGLKIPHMGWNDVTLHDAGHPLFDGLADGSHFYFVHGYHFRPDDPAHLLASVDYGGRLAAAVGRDNLIGTQFHPEKSQAAGLHFLSNFLRWSP